VKRWQEETKREVTLTNKELIAVSDDLIQLHNISIIIVAIIIAYFSLLEY